MDVHMTDEAVDLLRVQGGVVALDFVPPIS
jgi:hypothetical protein